MNLESIDSFRFQPSQLEAHVQQWTFDGSYDDDDDYEF